MANPAHVEIVEHGTKAINAWREANPDSRLELRGANLRGANLRGANLSDVNLRDVNLSEANLSEANLNEADLLGANLREADLTQANLCMANLCKANLCKADLCAADLSKAYLCWAKLIRAKLVGTELDWADLRNADLSRAKLYGAGLTEVDLRETNLRGADLREADLRGANLSGADLRETDLRKVMSWKTFWVELDLSKTVGLESIEHLGPSSLGVDTLMKSKGQIPEIFLRGCGLADDFVSYIPSHFTNFAIDFYSCFISYSHEDKPFARRLHDALQGRGIRCWLDEKKMLPGDDFGEHIDRGIKVWDKVLLCASKHSLTSYWVNKELEHTFAKEEQLFKREKKPIRSLIPLNLDGYLFNTWEHKEKNSICNRLAADFTDWETDNSKFEEQFERVVKALQTNNAGRDPDPIPKL